jgi:serine/threonine protein kinase
MDYCDGGNVKELYRAAQWGSKGGKGSVMSEGCISSLMYQVAEALNFMHSQHLIHRDIKPSSLLVSSSGLVSVTNLGNLRKIAKTTGQAASVVGSTCYMSPERIVGVHFTNSADIWGLGLTVLECVCGGYPFEQHQHNYMALLEHIVQSPCPVDLVEPSDLPAGLADVLRLCLDKVASKRPTAQQLLDMQFVSSGKKAQEELANLVRALLGDAAGKGDPQMSPTGAGDKSPPQNKKPGLTPLGGIPV